MALRCRGRHDSTSRVVADSVPRVAPIVYIKFIHANFGQHKVLTLKTVFQQAQHNVALLVAWVIGLAYATGVMTVHRYYPSLVDFVPNLESALVLFVGLVAVFVLLPIRRMGLDSVFWLLLLLLIALQPMLSDIPYPDGSVSYTHLTLPTNREV